MYPFSSKAVFRPNDIEVLPGDTWHGFELNTELQSQTLYLAEGQEIKLSSLEPDILSLSINDVSLDSLKSSQIVSASLPSDTNTDTADENHESEPDVWTTGDLSCSRMKSGLLSWDRFYEHYVSPAPHCLSEAGHAVFDAVISREWSTEDSKLLRHALLDPLVQGGLNVLVGRSSEIFVWDHATNSFHFQLADVALVGHSVGLTTAFCQRLCDCGDLFRSINMFCQSTLSTNSTVFAIRSAFLQILRAIETDLQRKRPTQLTIVRLETLCSKYTEIYTILESIVAKVEHPLTEPNILAGVIRLIDELWHSNYRRSVLLALAEKILESGVRETQERIGLFPNSASIVEADLWIFADLLPDLAPIFYETVRCLQIGEHHGLQQYTSGKKTLSVKLIHRWSDLADLQKEADLMDLRSRDASTRPACNSGVYVKNLAPSRVTAPPLSNPFGLDFHAAPSVFASGRQETIVQDRLADLVLAMLNDQDDETTPDLSPTQMLSMSIGPILATQHRVSSYGLLKKLFFQHKIIDHLKLLHAYQLFGNGMFVTNLSKALFDANQYNAEGRRITGLTAGLRLEDREIWPPASSELRLVLMGLLSDSSANNHSSELLDNISFAIRDLAEEDLEACRNVHSIRALDFLRLTYAPPNHIIELILTPKALDKYDRIFKFLLVLLRMHALSQNLMMTILDRRKSFSSNTTHARFCLELHHFVTSYLDYALNTAINMQWQELSLRFENIQSALLQDDYDLCMSMTGSISQLCKTHEDVLSEILVALLLGKNQVKLFAATCKIFDIGLRYAQHHSVHSEDQRSLQELKDLQQALSSWFVTISKSVDTGHTQVSRMVERLLERMDYSHYYHTQAKIGNTARLT